MNKFLNEVWLALWHIGIVTLWALLAIGVFALLFWLFNSGTAWGVVMGTALGFGIPFGLMKSEVSRMEREEMEGRHE